MKIQYSSELIHHLKKAISNQVIDNVFMKIQQDYLTTKDIEIIKNLIKLCISKKINLVICGNKTTLNKLEKYI